MIIDAILKPREVADSRGDLGNEVASGFSQPDTTMAALEQKDAQHLLKCLDPSTHT